MTSRRLAAIVVVDVAGYSRMMAEDEEGTLAVLKAHRNETDPIVLNHGGRIVKGTGDGLLIEFPSAVEAVQAAIDAQRLMAERNAVLPSGMPDGIPDRHQPRRCDRRGRRGCVRRRREHRSSVGGTCRGRRDLRI